MFIYRKLECFSCIQMARIVRKCEVRSCLWWKFKVLACQALVKISLFIDERGSGKQFLFASDNWSIADDLSRPLAVRISFKNQTKKQVKVNSFHSGSRTLLSGFKIRRRTSISSALNSVGTPQFVIHKLANFDKSRAASQAI